MYTFRILVFIMLLFLISTRSFGSEIEWDRFDFVVIASRVFPQGDFGKYWDDSFGIGGGGRYFIGESFYLVGYGIFSRYEPSRNEGNLIIPPLSLINISAGFKYVLNLSETVGFTASTGGENFTFIFRGKGREILPSNFIESEVGFYFEGGLIISPRQTVDIHLFFRHSTVLSPQPYIRIFSSGISVYF